MLLIMSAINLQLLFSFNAFFAFLKLGIGIWALFAYQKKKDRAVLVLGLAIGFFGIEELVKLVLF